MQTSAQINLSAVFAIKTSFHDRLRGENWYHDFYTIYPPQET